MFCIFNKDMKNRISFPPVSIWVDKSQRFSHIWVQKMSKEHICAENDAIINPIWLSSLSITKNLFPAAIL